MARINLCFVWHMHQPFYRDLVSGEFRQPWVRLHALKDYYGMVELLEEFPEMRQTFNLTPSLLVQLSEYASGAAKDPFLNVSLKEAEHLDIKEKEFLLNQSFLANEHRMIRRYPRYAELLEAKRQNDQIPGRAAEAFTVPMLRDLQVLSKLVWMDEDMLARDSGLASLSAKGRNYTRADQELLSRSERDLIGKAFGAYRAAAGRGQIEISTSAFYHPILPLICDSNVADISHPYVALPTQFAYPADAAAQIISARNHVKQLFGADVKGLWPSEGAVSDETLKLIAEAGFEWTASDEMVLARTLGRNLTAKDRYQGYSWSGTNQHIKILFRDQRLCELIGTVYGRMEAEPAAEHFVRELTKRCEGVISAGDHALVTVVLDGENAWEHYEQNGRPFLRALYRRISEDPEIETCTVSQALREAKLGHIEKIFPGSWIDGNFDIWIGAEEDNQAWEYLLQARRCFDRAKGVAGDKRCLAWEELMIAEGSDWYWWYGPEHAAPNRADFDRLFRGHLRNMYTLLGEPAPDYLAQSILKPTEREHRPPAGLIQPVIDGKQTSHAEWANAGRYRAPNSTGPIHSLRSPFREVLYGSDGRNLFLWLARGESAESSDESRLAVQIRNSNGDKFVIDLAAGDGGVTIESELPEDAVSAALQDAWEIRVSLAALHARPGSQVFIRIEVSQRGLPMGSMPDYGELELKQSPMAAYTY